jgi:glycosyltransferase involved in cell wall biosynthesis
MRINKKINIHFFFRKPRLAGNFSIERTFDSFIPYINKKHFKIKKIICPFVSNGIINRIFIIIWAFFKQGDINHVTGDINFISFFFTKKTITTFLDCFLLKKLKPIKLFFFKKFWVILPIKKSFYSVAISNQTKKELINCCKSFEDKILEIPVCYHRSLKKSNYSFNFKKPSILIIGTAKNKNIINSLKSLKNIQCKVIIIGKLNDSMLKFLEKTDLDYLNYINLSNEKINIQYKKSDIILFPSTYEGFGLPIIEGQVCGKAVITSNISPMKDIAGVNGACLVNPYKVKEISNAILNIINNKKYREKLINNGIKNSKHYSPKLIAKKYMSLYYKLSGFKI